MQSFKEHLQEELQEVKDNFKRDSLTNKKGDKLKVINNLAKKRISLTFIPKRDQAGKTFTVKNQKAADKIIKAFNAGKDLKAMFETDGKETK